MCVYILYIYDSSGSKEDDPAIYYRWTVAVIAETACTKSRENGDKSAPKSGMKENRRTVNRA